MELCITFVKFSIVCFSISCDQFSKDITPIRVARLFLDCNGDFAIKAYNRYAMGESVKRFEQSNSDTTVVCKIVLTTPK